MVDVLDGSDKNLPALQEDAVHPSLDLTSNAKNLAPPSTMNLSMLLPVPQGKASDKLKPIIEFLGEESQGKIQKNSSSLGENLPIPKDARPGVTTKMDSSASSQSEDVIVPSILAKQMGISSFLEQSLSSGTSQKSLQNNNLKMTPPKTVEVSPDNTEELVKSFLEGKFGQTLGKNLLSLGSLSDVSYKNLMEQHFGSSIKATSAPATQTPPNEDLISKIVSGLVHQSTEHGTTNNSVVNSKNVSENKISQGVKPGSAQVTNSVSSPTISIGDQVFSLHDLSNALNHDKDNEEHAQSITNITNAIVGSTKGNRKHSVKQKKKAKIKQLSEKIATLETLSDALDALTAKLSSDEKPETNLNDDSVAQNMNEGDSPRGKHKGHHSHHHHRDKTQLEEDVDVLGALLSRANTHSDLLTKADDNPQVQKDSSYIVGIKGEKSLNSGDLENLETKINKAIEVTESMGRQQDAKQAKSTWLPLLLAGKLIQEGAHTRQEVTSIHTNHSKPERSLSLKDSKIHGLEEILMRVIDNALRTGSLNDLVKNWNRSGSPFAKIAQNISLFLQGDKYLKLPLTRTVNSTAVTTSLARKPTSKSTLTFRLLKGISGFDKTSSANKRLFTKAVNDILGEITKRQNGNSSDHSLYATTDTLTDFKGVLLGGRINKLIPSEDSIAATLGTKIMAEILRDQAKDSVKANSPKQQNQTIDNKTTFTSNLTVHEKSLEKEKLKFSSYDTRNMSRHIHNNTLEEFMNSLSKTGRHNPPSPINEKQGDKHSRLLPHLSDLMSVITASILDMGDVDQESSPHKKKTTFQYDDSGNERFLNRLPNDHTSSDYSTADMILKGPNDHAGKGKSKEKRPGHLLSSSPAADTLTQNKTRELNNKTASYNENTDQGDQTVTLTLETVDDTPSPLKHNHGDPKGQNNLRSNKVPHHPNNQAATTLGKINSTVYKNREHSFHESDVSTVLSELKVNAKKPELPLQSAVDGKLMTILPSPGTGEDSKTREIANLPLGLQMNAIGRLADTKDEASVIPSDMTSVLTSSTGLTDRLALESTQRKSSGDKILPVASDLPSTSAAITGSETEAIVSKAAASKTARVETPFKATPYKDLPTASEVREISTSIKALLKILNSYSKRLRLEYGEDDTRSDLLPVRSRTAEKVASEEKTKTEDTKTKQAGSSSNFGDIFHAIFQKEKSFNALMKPSRTSLVDRKVNSKNPYVNFPQSSPLTPNYVGSSSFEHIHEQASTHPATQPNYNWNFDSVPETHAQSPLDANPTKSSVQPQVGTGPWSPGKEVSPVMEELKDLNLPSIEDDPTVRAVQKIVAEENLYANQKRKAIQRHEQQVSSAQNNHLPGKLGIFGRNTIPSGKGKGHQRNTFRTNQGKKEILSGKRNIKKKPNTGGRERNEIPHIIQNDKNISGHQKLGIHQSRPTSKENFIRNGTNQKESHRQRMTGRDMKLTQPVSGSNRPHGSRNNSVVNNSVGVTIHRNNDNKTKSSLNKDIQTIHSNAILNSTVKAMAPGKQKYKGAALREKEGGNDKSTKTSSADEIKTENTIKKKKSSEDSAQT